MENSSKNTFINIFYLLFLLIISSQNLYGFVNTIPTDKSNQSKITEETRIERKTSNKQGRIINKLEKKIEQYKQKNQENKKGKGLLIAGLIFLLLGILLIASSAGAGLFSGLFLLIIGVPCIIAGIVLLLVFLFKQSD